MAAPPLPGDKPVRYWRDADLNLLKKYAQQAVLIDGSQPMTGGLITPGVDADSATLALGGGAGTTGVRLGRTNLWPETYSKARSAWSTYETVYAEATSNVGTQVVGSSGQSANINFNSVTVDTHNAIQNPTTNFVFRTPMAGLYLCFACVRVAPQSGTPNGQISIFAGGIEGGNMMVGLGWTGFGMTISVPLRLGANANVSVQIYNTTGINLVVQPWNTLFRILRIGGY